MGQQFFDINKLPSCEGMMVFPISMSKIGTNTQNPDTYWKHIEHFNPSKIDKTSESSKVGGLFVYTDFLYLYSTSPAFELKKKFMNQMVFHKNRFKNIIKGHPHFILDSVSFKVWSQFYLDNPRFVEYFEKLKNIYQDDDLFSKYILEDFNNMKNEHFKFDENQINFFLEEHLFCYLVTKSAMELQNKFINNREQWILMCYPGKPLKAHIYLHQLNPFKLFNEKNKYENCWYDLSEKKLYDFTKIDLESYDS